MLPLSTLRIFHGLKTQEEKARCEREELCSRLGSIGASIGSPPVALDDASLLPMPKYFFGFSPDERTYEPYLIELIYMVSLALDDLFVDKLRDALMPFGDSVVTLDDGKGTLRISKGGVPQIDITRAPVKICRQHALCVRPFAGLTRCDVCSCLRVPRR